MLSNLSSIFPLYRAKITQNLLLTQWHKSYMLSAWAIRHPFLLHPLDDYYDYPANESVECTALAQGADGWGAIGH